LVAVVVRIAAVVPRIAIVTRIAAVSVWARVAVAVVPAVAVSVPPFRVAIRIPITMTLVFDELDVSGVDRYCLRHDDRRGV
jgi:hypothetical protein